MVVSAASAAHCPSSDLESVCPAYRKFGQAVPACQVDLGLMALVDVRGRVHVDHRPHVHGAHAPAPYERGAALDDLAQDETAEHFGMATTITDVMLAGAVVPALAAGAQMSGTPRRAQAMILLAPSSSNMSGGTGIA